jgi:hypothetical protein
MSGIDLDARIVAAVAEDAVSGDVQCLLVAVEAAAKEAEAAAEEARAQALDPLVEGVIAARRAMDDDAFKRDRLTEAAKRLGVRVTELEALEKARAERAEHDRVLAEPNRLAEEMSYIAEPIARIAHLVSQIEACDREVGRVNATSALGLGHIPMVLSVAAPAIRALISRRRGVGRFRRGREAAVQSGGAGRAKASEHRRRTPAADAVVAGLPQRNAAAG